MHLRVSFQRARDFVEQYAENLSAGGLFVRGATRLALREQVTLELDLPGHGAFAVTAEVAHVVPPGDPHRAPGVGLSLVTKPPGFDDALTAYLMRLGRRPDAKVFVSHDPWRSLLADAGYHVLDLPPPHQLVQVLGDTAAVGLLAPEDLAEQYRAALAFLGEDGSLVIPLHPKLPVEPVLAWLDDKLL